MATVSYKVCDRCNKEINPHSMRKSRVPIVKEQKIFWITAGYVLESTKELCEECTKKLEDFLNNKI